MKLLMLLLIVILLIFLQIFFAKRSLIASLILPSIFFILSIYLTITSPYWVSYTKWIRPITFIVVNIPTIIFIGIYYGFRNNSNSKNNHPIS